MKPTVGIIGTGSFGQYLAKWLRPHAKVLLVGRGSTDTEYAAALASDAVILAVPLAAYPQVLEKLTGRLEKDTMLIDVCSTKERPLQLIGQALPGQPAIALHPLFGPETAPDSLAGQTVVLCPQPGMAEAETEVKRFLELGGLKVVEMPAAQHDQLMAELQALTFFVARTLVEYGVESHEIMTPSYRRLLNLADLERHHSLDLFKTIQANPYAAAVRQKFIEQASKLNDELNRG